MNQTAKAHGGASTLMHRNLSLVVLISSDSRLRLLIILCCSVRLHLPVCPRFVVAEESHSSACIKAIRARAESQQRCDGWCEGRLLQGKRRPAKPHISCFRTSAHPSETSQPAEGATAWNDAPNARPLRTIDDALKETDEVRWSDLRAFNLPSDAAQLFSTGGGGFY